MKSTYILVTGAQGQLGKALVAALRSEGYGVYALRKQDMDITDAAAVAAFLRTHSVSVWVNAAAYTQVDKAEEHSDTAYAVNARAVEIIAQQCSRYGIFLVHFSTDYVFDGKRRQPYREEDMPSPINVYGYTKYEGERLSLAANERTLIVRTSWLYDIRGRNFFTTMCGLMQKGGAVRVVRDQQGCPTYVQDLVVWLCEVLRGDLSAYYAQILHYANEGIASWYDFALAIREELMEGNFFKGMMPAMVLPVLTADYVSRAQRPMYSVLSKAKAKAMGASILHWRAALKVACAHLLKGSY